MRYPTHSSVPVKVIKSQSFVSGNLALRRDRSAIDADVLNVHRVGKNDGRLFRFRYIDSCAAVIVSCRKSVAWNAAAREGPVAVCAHLIAVATHL